MRRSATRYRDPNPTRNTNFRRRSRYPITRIPSSTTAAAAAAATPLLRWKPETGADPITGSDPNTRISARKLAAGVWWSEVHEIETGVVNLQVPQVRNHVSNPKNDDSSKIHDHRILERATKWDTKCSKPTQEISQSFDHLKLLMEQQMMKSTTLETKLKSELEWAHARVTELESKRHSSKKQLESFLKKYQEEKSLWRAREREKIQTIIETIRSDLTTERRNRRRTEVLNSKLIDELANVKKSAKQLSLEYEKERKARELIEEVCNELAKEVEEDRAHTDEAKQESQRAREELEEEKQMLQLAEVWREERVQMKLADAKQAVIDQCTKLNALKSELENFLRSKNLNKSDILEAKLLIESVTDAISMNGTTAFEYTAPPAGEDIFAIFEELQEPGSPATDIFLAEEPVAGAGDDSEWETLSGDDIGLPGLEEWSSPGSGTRNPGRGLKGCIEWPRGGGGAKQSLKSKLVEAKMESDKFQIRHLLKNKS